MRFKSSAAPAVYETTYDCSVSETRGALRLEAQPDHVGWSEQVQGVRVSAILSLITDTDKLRFPSDGFRNRLYDHPIVFFDYPDALRPEEDAGFAIKGQPLETFSAEPGGGGNAIQKPVSSNVFLSLDWKQIQLLESDGVMSVFLYDRSGTVHKTLQLSRQRFDEIEHSLETVYAQVLVKKADRQHRCRADTHEVEPPIVIAD